MHSYRYTPLFIILWVLSLFNAPGLLAQRIGNDHKTVAILPAFYLDNVDTGRLNSESQKLKLIGTYKKEIGIDVQYKFYLPLMLKQEKHSVFFRGVDTINKIMENKGISFTEMKESNFKLLDSLLKVDAIIILELKEINTYYKNTNSTILSSLLNPDRSITGRISDAEMIRQSLNNQTVALTLTAKIYECSSNLYLWQTSVTITNKYYHDAVRILTEKIHKRLPYRKK